MRFEAGWDRLELVARRYSGRAILYVDLTVRQSLT